MRRGFLVVTMLFLAGGLLCPAGVSAQRAPEIIRGTKKVTPQPSVQPSSQPEAQPKAQPGTQPAAPPAGTNVSYQQGLKYLNSGNYGKAVKAFQQALAANPRSAEGYYYLGLAYDGQGDQDKAIKSLATAVRLKPNFSEARVALGQIYNLQGLNLLRQGNPGQAEAVFKEAVAQDPKNDAAFNNLGVALGQQGQFTRSLAALQKAVSLNPNNNQAQFNLGVTQYSLGDKNATVRQYAILTLRDPNAADELFRIIQNTSQVATPFRF
jgi:Flp pilus assembly protein TadD